MFDYVACADIITIDKVSEKHRNHFRKLFSEIFSQLFFNLIFDKFKILEKKFVFLSFYIES